MMDELLDPVRERAMAYIDDTAIFSKGDASVHVKHVGEVLDILLRANLWPNWRKCKFGCKKMEYVGHIVSKNGIEIDQRRVSKIINMPAPRNVQEIRMFNGMVVFYQRFIRKFSDTVEPLTVLTRKDVYWRWGDREQKA
jgi:hypothetical protein